jgi:hypothetical protein
MEQHAIGCAGAVACFSLCNGLPYMQMRNCVEQNHAERDQDCDDSEPQEYERALVLPGLRRGDAEDKREASEYRGQELDHVGCADPILISRIRSAFF